MKISFFKLIPVLIYILRLCGSENKFKINTVLIILTKFNEKQRQVCEFFTCTNLNCRVKDTNKQFYKYFIQNIIFSFVLTQ